MSRNKGGGNPAPSGGNDNLWNTQAEQVRQSMAMSGELFDYWQKYAPWYLSNAAGMVGEAQDGQFAQRVRDQASADAAQGLGIGLSAATRNMERYGAEMNPGKAWYALRDAGVSSALARTDAVNKATQWAENQRWARNQDAHGLVSGMPGNATSMLGTANSGMGNMAGMQNNANQMAAQNAAGFGRMGAALAYGLFRADGGSTAPRHEQGLAFGGVPNPASTGPVKGWRARMDSMPRIAAPQMQMGSPLGQLIAGAAPVAIASLAKPAATALWEAGKSALLGQAANAGAGITGSIAPTLANAAKTAATAPGMTGALGAGIKAGATQAATSAGAGALGSGVTGSIAPTLASASEGATLAAGAANSWNPLGWGLLAAGAIAALSDMFADGGQPQSRVDMHSGGMMDGPGTPTSDSIPIWASDDEYVLNAEAVKQIGVDKLDKLNERGLKARYGKQARMINGVAHPDGAPAQQGNRFALGGNLGIALGAAAREWTNQREQSRRDEEAQLRKTAAAREAEQFEWERTRQEREASMNRQVDAAMAQSRQTYEDFYSNDPERRGRAITAMTSAFNADPSWNGGMTVQTSVGPDGQTYVSMVDRDGVVQSQQPLSNEFANQAMQAHLINQLARIRPDIAMQKASDDRQYGLKLAQNKLVEEHNRAADEHYRRMDETARARLNAEMAIQKARLVQQERALASRGAGGGGHATVIGTTKDGTGLVVLRGDTAYVVPLPKDTSLFKGPRTNAAAVPPALSNALVNLGARPEVPPDANKKQVAATVAAQQDWDRQAAHLASSFGISPDAVLSMVSSPVANAVPSVPAPTEKSMSELLKEAHAVEKAAEQKTPPPRRGLVTPGAYSRYDSVFGAR